MHNEHMAIRCTHNTQHTTHNTQHTTHNTHSHDTQSSEQPLCVKTKSVRSPGQTARCGGVWMLCFQVWENLCAFLDERSVFLAGKLCVVEYQPQVIVVPHTAEHMSFPLGPQAQSDTVAALKSLAAHERKRDKDAHEFVFLVITTDTALTKTRDHTPRIIPIPNRLSRVAERSILLITKDPSTPYRGPLQAAKSPTEDLFKDIMPLKKVKTLCRSSKSAKNMFSEYDLIVADHRVHHLLPSAMGEVFYKAHKKVPFVVQLAPFTDATVSIDKKNKNKQETVDPAFVLKQLKSIAKNTCYFPSRDASVSIKIGYLDMDADKLVQNIGAVVEFLRSPKFLPAGGVLKKAGMKQLFVKTGDSASMPVWSRE